jgi:tripartite-type tricarboxylate transporter receptor subunit TctC
MTMKLQRRRFLHVAGGAAVVAVLPRMARAQAFPTRPITIVVPFAAGGPLDRLTRVVAEGMRKQLGQPLLIENVTGAAGSIGVARVVQARPDGYTIGAGNWSTHVANGAVYALTYDLINDLEPVALLPSNPMLIVTRKALAVASLAELIALLKANPDKFVAGTAGTGSGSHLAGVYFQTITGTRFQFVPIAGPVPR